MHSCALDETSLSSMGKGNPFMTVAPEKKLNYLLESSPTIAFLEEIGWRNVKSYSAGGKFGQYKMMQNA